MDDREVCSLGSAHGPGQRGAEGPGRSGTRWSPRLGRSVESAIVPSLEHSNNHGGRSCIKQSGRFTLDVPTAFQLKDINLQRMSKKTLSSSATRQKQAGREDSLVRRGDSVSNGLAGLHLAPRGPLISTWSKFLPQSLPSCRPGTSRPARPGGPCRRIHLAAYHRAKA